MQRLPLLLAALLALLATVSAAADRAPVALTGSVGIAYVEGEPYAMPPENSPLWSHYELTEAGLSRPLERREGVAWAVIRVRLPAVPGGEGYSLLISNPADADEVYLNGVFVEKNGEIRPEYVTAPRGPRLIELPSGFLRAGENVVAMKLLFAERDISFMGGPILFGTAGDLTALWAEERTPLLVMEAAYFSFFLAVFLVYGFLVINGMNRPDFVLFLVFIGLNQILFLLDSNILALAGVELAAKSRLQLLLPALRIPIMLTLVTKLTGGKTGLIYKGFFATAALYVLLCVALPPLTTHTLLKSPYLYFIAALGLYYVYLSLDALLRKREDATAVLVGVAAYVVGSRLDLFIGTDLHEFGVGIFSISMLFALMARHARLNRRLIDVSGRLLDAHEEERKRLARDIHDGIGQAVAGLKLRLQIFERKMSKGGADLQVDVRELIGSVGALVEDVRRVALDLRPSFLENTSLRDAIEGSARSFLRDAKVDFYLHGELAPEEEPTRKVKDCLYRISQEILSNAVKHSRANRIDLSIHREGGMVVLKASDNGVGFDPAGVAEGLGLKTMRERAEIAGGSFEVDSAPGRGTRIRVEVRAT